MTDRPTLDDQGGMLAGTEIEAFERAPELASWRATVATVARLARETPGDR